ncbi:MAG: sodium:solute symporter [Sporocytophaga sp.]|uniref:sodium:solute symporter n=1 Tax=Sporocytophaga sp. TaxID=2231183 RepID=UPI001B2C9229|nr:sodium:solute symporter [Sporocytophaga sp.]MBO9701757.1 sodium:solute symporter [Sporocytophaga sp.]
MSITDWIVLCGTLTFIIGYGIWKTRGSKNIEDFLLAKTMPWYTICLSIMATQASAITFLSTPGQAYDDGMRFIQFYYGLPIAMVIIAITAVPLYAKMNVYTAYEYLEGRFDFKTRTLAALLFLIQRGVSTGITIYAPSIILSTILGWNLNVTNIIIGSLVILYTVTGGTKAVSVTQQQQMAVMMGGIILAGIVIIYKLPADISLFESVQVAGKLGKMNLVDFNFQPNDRYNFWSGITGGMFLALSYFGTDQSQVGRYLSGKSITESRMGLLFNGLLKIPMQFIILFIGLLVFVFYQFHQAPVFFNKTGLAIAKNSVYAGELKTLEEKYDKNFIRKKDEVNTLVTALKAKDQQAIDNSQGKLLEIKKEEQTIRNDVKKVILQASPDSEVKDVDFVFITFIMTQMPQGLVGLLIAVILCAAMSSTASALNALASTTCVDIYKRSLNPHASERHYLKASRALTIVWGLLTILFALFASKQDNLIQAVNILGSLFYGTILGIFLCAFYFKYIKSNAVFIAAIMAQVTIFFLYFYSDIAFLWYNLIGPVIVIAAGYILQLILSEKEQTEI